MSSLWNTLIAGYHYLGYTPLVGAQQRYLIESEHHGVRGGAGLQCGGAPGGGARSVDRVE